MRFVLGALAILVFVVGFIAGRMSSEFSTVIYPVPDLVALEPHSPPDLAGAARLDELTDLVRSQLNLDDEEFDGSQLEMLEDLLQMNLWASSSWSEPLLQIVRADPHQAGLVVRARDPTQEQVQEILAKLRDWARPRITVYVWFVRARSAVGCQLRQPHLLSNSQAGALMKNLQQNPRSNISFGSRITFANGAGCKLDSGLWKCIVTGTLTEDLKACRLKMFFGLDNASDIELIQRTGEFEIPLGMTWAGLVPAGDWPDRIIDRESAVAAGLEPSRNKGGQSTWLMITPVMATAAEAAGAGEETPSEGASALRLGGSR